MVYHWHVEETHLEAFQVPLCKHYYHMLFSFIKITFLLWMSYSPKIFVLFWGDWGWNLGLCMLGKQPGLICKHLRNRTHETEWDWVLEETWILKETLATPAWWRCGHGCPKAKHTCSLYFRGSVWRPLSSPVPSCSAGEETLRGFIVSSYERGGESLPRWSALGLHQNLALRGSFPLHFHLLGAKFPHSWEKFLTWHLLLTLLIEERSSSPEALTLSYWRGPRYICGEMPTVLDY